MTAQTTAPPLDPTRVRASHAEREDTVARLHQALGEGRLDLAETEERSAAAYAAQYRDELPPLLADLPQAGAPRTGAGAPAWSELWVSAVWRARTALVRGGDRPSDRQCRTAAVLVALALLCALLGAGLVGAVSAGPPPGHGHHHDAPRVPGAGR